MIRRALVLVFAFAATATQAGEMVLESKPARTHLLELFTSQGCSSCPAAEAWLSNLKNEPRLWQDFVPVAFHVDYWDHLGWRDPFASGKWTERQATYSARWKTDSVFTGLCSRRRALAKYRRSIRVGGESRRFENFN